MSDFLWRKDEVEAAGGAVMHFMAGQDVILDRELLPFDIRASQAHVRGLASIGVVSAGEADRLMASMDDLLAAFRAGEFVLDERFEDGHSAIEAWLTDRLGDTGRKVHAGRSRNDQVAVAMRLYLRDRLECLAEGCHAIAQVALDRAAREGGVPMPGHTHLQKAMPSSLGLWWAGHAEAFADNLSLARATRAWLNASPLGTASGFGVNLPLARDAVARELDFDRLVVNPQYAQNSRGKVELRALDALHAATGDLRRLAWDLSLFASAEFGYLRLPDRYCTGSSIMPNKHNPDTVELLRATHPVVTGARGELDALLSLPSGYQRDLQNTKPPVLRAFGVGLQALALVPELLAGVEWDTERLRAGITPDMHATDLANEKVASGMPFRDAYKAAAAQMGQLAERRPEDSVKARVSPGGCGRLELNRIRQRLD